MSLGHGASIVRNGLVFQYDMSNTAKSWKGKPTTNYAYENGYTSNGPLITENIPNYKELKNLAGDVKDVRYINNNTTNWLDLYSVNNIPLAAGEMVTISCWIYTDKPANAFNANGNFEATLGTNAGLGGYSNIPTGKWFFFSKSKTNTTASTITVNTLRIETNQYTVWTDSEIDVYAANPQWEVSTFPTPFVDGTRSNTEALIDLTGNNTLTASNLIYNSDNTFSFDDSTNSVINPGKSREVMFPSIDTYSYVCIAKRNGAPSTAQSHAIVFGAQGFNTGLLWYNSDNKVRMGAWYDNAGSWANKITDAGSTAIADDTWVHLAGTFNAYGNMSCYVNGQLVSAVDVSGNTASSGNTWYNGPVSAGGGVSAFQFNGSVAQALGYDRELSAEEIADHFEATRGRYGI